MKKKLFFLSLTLFVLSLCLLSCSSTANQTTSATSINSTALETLVTTSNPTTSLGTAVTTSANTTTPITTAQTSQTATNVTTHTPVETTPVVTTAESTTEPPVEITIPQNYFQDLDAVIVGSSITIPAKYNKGIACDLHPSVIDGTLYFFLPSTADLSQVVYEVYLSSGKLRTGRVADFTSDSTDGKRITLNNRTYTAVAISSDSPAMFIEIDEQYASFEDVKNDKNKDTKAYGSLIITCREDVAEKYGFETYYNSKENDSDSPCSMYIKGRGNWTWNKTDKKGFSIKLEKKEDLLGMGKSKKWALVGNMTDATMLRNTVASYLGQAANFSYTPTSELIDLFVNGVYQGSYLLSEKVNIEDGRLEMTDLEDKIEELDPQENHGKQASERTSFGCTIKYWTEVENPEDITGGYILELEMSDRYQNEPSGFVTKRGTCYVIKSPEYASYEQVTYIANFMQEFEDAIYQSSGYHSKTGKHYTDYIDLDSFVNKYWIDEISKNRDGAKTSHYLYKPSDAQSSRLYAGPIWDYDIAFGISSETVNPEGWFSRTEKALYRALFKHADFKKKANEVFLETFYPAIVNLLNEKIDTMADRIVSSVEMNDILWNVTTKDYEKHVEDLKNYLERRITWIKNQIS